MIEVIDIYNNLSNYSEIKTNNSNNLIESNG